MSRNIALTVSIAGHPVFINALSLWLLLWLYPQLHYVVHPSMKLFYLGFIFFSTAVLPMLYVLFMLLMRKTGSLMLEQKEDRNMPYIITAILYLFDFYLSQKAGSPPLISAYLLACSSIVVAVLIVNLYVKISIHAASLGALLAVVLCAAPVAAIDVRYLLAAGLLVSGLVVSSRLFLEAHRPVEVYSGFLLGLGVMWFIL